jgi:hypothetical protein
MGGDFQGTQLLQNRHYTHLTPPEGVLSVMACLQQLRIDSSQGLLIFHCERSSSDSPLGRRLCWNILRCSVTDPSEEVWTIEDEQCQKIGGGYKALKFRFLLFL